MSPCQREELNDWKAQFQGIVANAKAGAKRKMAYRDFVFFLVGRAPTKTAKSRILLAGKCFHRSGAPITSPSS